MKRQGLIREGRPDCKQRENGRIIKRIVTFHCGYIVSGGTYPRSVTQMESGKSKPKARFSTKLPNGDYLQIAVWPGKTDPAAEVVNVQVRHMSEGEWMTTGRLALYRAKDGSYTQLPDRPPVSPSKPSDKSGQTGPSTDLS